MSDYPTKNIELYAKDEEIERLNGELLDQTDRLHWLTNENEAQKKLLARAADALEHLSWVTQEYCGLASQCHDLVAELRKAAE